MLFSYAILQPGRYETWTTNYTKKTTSRTMSTTKIIFHPDAELAEEIIQDARHLARCSMSDIFKENRKVLFSFGRKIHTPYNSE